MIRSQSDAPPEEAARRGKAGRAGCRIAVIGAGFSGVLVTLHLLWRCGRDDRVYLVERGARLGEGAAYSTGNPRHLLNVRVENMSAFADEPDHFVRWLAALPEEKRQAAGERGFAGMFVRRQVYGAYVQHLLEERSPVSGAAATCIWYPMKPPHFASSTTACCSRPREGGPTGRMPRCWPSAIFRRTKAARRATSATRGTPRPSSASSGGDRCC
jgi:FAD-NAD(P)-binding